MTTPVYRFFTANVLTGAVLGELPLYGVYMDKSIKRAGNFTGTFRLDTGIEDDAELLSASVPMKTKIFCQRDGVTVWGGIIWSRTYESNAKTVQLSGQTFESYLAKVTIDVNFIRTNTNQLVILKDLINQLQTNPRSNLGIDTATMDTTGGTVKSLAVPFYDYKYYLEAISELANADNGFDWYINVVDGSTIDQPELVLVAGQPNISVGNSGEASQVFDYPGTIDQFYWPESGSRSGTDFILLGVGSGSNMLTAVGTWDGAETYPKIDQIFTRKDIANEASLNGIAQATAAAYGAAVTNPTITLKSDAVPEFESWNSLGSYIRFELESPRFATKRKVITKRLLGWEFRPADTQQVETVKLVIEGEEEIDA